MLQLPFLHLLMDCLLGPQLLCLACRRTSSWSICTVRLLRLRQRWVARLLGDVAYGGDSRYGVCDFVGWE